MITFVFQSYIFPHVYNFFPTKRINPFPDIKKKFSHNSQDAADANFNDKQYIFL